MHIIRAQIAHLDELVILFEAYRNFYKMPPDESRARNFLEERMKRNESVIFIAYESESAAGFTQLYPLFSSTRIKRLWLLNDLYVREKFRGQGVAAALIHEAEKLAIETGAAGIQLETAKDNFSAQRLYERTGFVLETDYHTYFLKV
jgi:ribosomal protein S18 acetylase RimI-like enzyme